MRIHETHLLPVVSTRQVFTHQPLVRSLLAAGLACSLMLSGCSRDPGEQALNNATVTLASLDVGVGSQLPPELTRTKLQSVISDLEPLTTGDSPQAGDAAVLLGMAHRGMALQDFKQIAANERDLSLAYPAIRTQLHNWEMNNATATATAQYDPAPELADIDDQIAAKQKNIAKAEAKAKEIENTISSLLAQVNDRLNQAADLRKQAGQLKLQMADVSATEGLALAKQVRELSRRADKLEFEARELKNKADQLGLDQKAAAEEIKKFKTQIELLGKARLSVQQRASLAEKTAADARGRAQQAGDDIADRLENADHGVIVQRQTIDAAYEPVLNQLSKALRSAQSGSSARRSTAKLTIGQIQQSIGDVHFTHALSLEGYADLLTELADADPALANAAQYADHARQAREAAIADRSAAFDAYKSAIDAYNGAGARGEVKTLIEQANTKLRQLAGKVGAGAVDAQALSNLQDEAASETQEQDDAANERANESDASNAAEGDDESQLRQMLRDMATAFADGHAVEGIAMIEPASDADAAILDKMDELMAGTNALDSATEAAFGQKFSEWALANMGQGQVNMSMNPQEMFNNIDDLDIRISGDQAVAISPQAGTPDITFHKVNGQWKMVLDMKSLMAGAMPAGTSQDSLDKMLGMFPELYDAQAQAYQEIVQEVKDGTLQSNQAVAVRLQTKLQPVMMKLMQAMMPDMGGG